MAIVVKYLLQWENSAGFVASAARVAETSTAVLRDKWKWSTGERSWSRASNSCFVWSCQNWFSVTWNWKRHYAKYRWLYVFCILKNEVEKRTRKWQNKIPNFQLKRQLLKVILQMKLLRRWHSFGMKLRFRCCKISLDTIRNRTVGAMSMRWSFYCYAQYLGSNWGTLFSGMRKVWRILPERVGSHIRQNEGFMQYRNYERV